MKTVHLNSRNLAGLVTQAIPTVMALGFFDGIHKGHRQVIKMASRIAKEKNLPLSVMSFFPHPKTVIGKGKEEFAYLMPLSEKEKIFYELGVDLFYIVEFTKEFSSLSPEQFVHNYLLDLGAVHVVAGFDYTYGKRGKGNMDRLKEDSGGVLDVTKVEKVEANGEKISSTYIRNKLAAGKVEDLPCLLERPYEVVCNWQGTALQVGTFYTLPAPGRYLVTMKTERLSQLMIAKVVDRRHVIPENGLFSEMLNQQESVTVTWHQRINEKHTEVVMLNDWIQKAMANHVSI